MTPATEYVSLGESSRPIACGWPHTVVALLLTSASAAAGALVMHVVDTAAAEAKEVYTYEHVPQVAELADGVPRACAGWEVRCLAGAASAQEQGLGKFFGAALCDEKKKGKISCANRKAVWSSSSIALRPFGETDTERMVTNKLTRPHLLLFLPGTGTAPKAVRTLVAASSDMGFHALGLSYASNPLAVSQADVWCTRLRGADGAPNATAATACNRQLHESVLFGTPSGAEGGGLWDVSKEESVVTLVLAALKRLGWDSLFLDANGRVRWELVVVSGHSQGASHAAYLSTRVPVKAAVLFSGPQEATPATGWIHDAPNVLRRAAFSHREECGDEPEEGAERESYCATQFPRQLQRNLDAMGLRRGQLGSHSGYVITDFEPLLSDGRDEHNAQALQAYASPAHEALWKVLFAPGQAL